MIILDRSGRDLTRRPPALFRAPRAALLALALAGALLGAGPAPAAPDLAAPPAGRAQASQERPAPLARAFRQATPI